MATAPAPAPATPKKVKKNIFRRILAFFKYAAEWVPEHLGDPAYARTLREDLGLAEGADVPADLEEKFKRFAAGLDVDKASFLDTVEQIHV